MDGLRPQPGQVRRNRPASQRAQLADGRPATVAELGAGLLLAAGLGNALAAAAVIGTMVVALVANHLKNGFFIFRPGEGYEYVLMITVVAAALAALGPGRISLDHALGTEMTGLAGLIVALVAGAGGAALLLGLCWRPVGPDGAPGS
jgi:putative oxidoreductase